jgi:hypothetical protein
MSGGHFNHACYAINNLASDLKHEIKDDTTTLAATTKKNMAIAAAIIEIIGDLAHDVEWRYSGDTGDKDFNRNFKEHITKLRTILRGYR